MRTAILLDMIKIDKFDSKNAADYCFKFELGKMGNNLSLVPKS